MRYYIFSFQSSFVYMSHGKQKKLYSVNLHIWTIKTYKLISYQSVYMYPVDSFTLPQSVYSIIIS